MELNYVTCPSTDKNILDNAICYDVMSCLLDFFCANGGTAEDNTLTVASSCIDATVDEETLAYQCALQAATIADADPAAESCVPAGL